MAFIFYTREQDICISLVNDLQDTSGGNSREAVWGFCARARRRTLARLIDGMSAMHQHLDVGERHLCLNVRGKKNKKPTQLRFAGDPTSVQKTLKSYNQVKS